MARAGWNGPVAALLLGLTLGSGPVEANNLAPPAPDAPGSRELAAQAPAVGGMWAYRNQLRQHVRDARHDVLEAHVAQQLELLRQGKIPDETVNDLLKMVSAADEDRAGVFDAWAEAYPSSPVGPLVRAYFNLHRAWKGRGERFAFETSADEFREMERWLPLVRRDVQMALHRAPACSLCYGVLIWLSMPAGLRKEAPGWFQRGLQIDPNSTVVPEAYFESLADRWGGSSDQQAALLEKLGLAGHITAQRQIAALAQAHKIEFWKWTGPQEARAGLAAARASLAIQDNYPGRYAEAYSMYYLGRHAEAVEAFTRMVERHNVGVRVFETRAQSYVELRRWPEALRDLRIAYEHFQSPWAFQILVRLSVGNTGWPLRTNSGEYPQLCKEAALKGIAVAMTCLGGLHFSGTGGVPKDAVAARRWFQRAAEAGDVQGMMDLSNMADRGQGGAVDRDQAVRWWMAAAVKGHLPAQRKLESELSFLERLRYQYWPQVERRMSGWWRTAWRLIQFVFLK